MQRGFPARVLSSHRTASHSLPAEPAGPRLPACSQPHVLHRARDAAGATPSEASGQASVPSAPPGTYGKHPPRAWPQRESSKTAVFFEHWTSSIRFLIPHLRRVTLPLRSHLARSQGSGTNSNCVLPGSFPLPSGAAAVLRTGGGPATPPLVGVRHLSCHVGHTLARVMLPDHRAHPASAGYRSQHAGAPVE